jgi:Bacterial Ig domain
VLANDSGSEGDSLIVTGVSDPLNGTATVNPDNTVTYDPDGCFAGTDMFTYTISDGRGGPDSATVTVRVRKTSRGPRSAKECAPSTSSGAMRKRSWATTARDDLMGVAQQVVSRDHVSFQDLMGGVQPRVELQEPIREHHRRAEELDTALREALR